MSPPRAETAAFGSAKWWGQFAKSGSTIRTGIFAIIVSIGYGISAFCSWASNEVIKPTIEDARADKKQIIAQNIELTGLVKILQQDMAKRDVESSRLATEMTRTNTILSERERDLDVLGHKIDQYITQDGENGKRLTEELREIKNLLKGNAR